MLTTEIMKIRDPKTHYVVQIQRPYLVFTYNRLYNIIHIIYHVICHVMSSTCIILCVGNEQKFVELIIHWDTYMIHTPTSSDYQYTENIKIMNQIFKSDPKSGF